MNHPTMAEFKANRQAYNKGHLPFSVVDSETRLAELARDRETASRMQADYTHFAETATSEGRREAYETMAAKHGERLRQIDLESTMLKTGVESAADLQALASRAEVGSAIGELKSTVDLINETDEEKLERIQREIRQFEESADDVHTS